MTIEVDVYRQLHRYKITNINIRHCMYVLIIYTGTVPLTICIDLQYTCNQAIAVINMKQIISTMMWQLNIPNRLINKAESLCLLVYNTMHLYEPAIIVFVSALYT